ncbi:MAG: hypothetical protein IPK50_18445 [Fibrobacterota bacterium]|nr:hypothetical protein [Fibrobacterota bacterium]QQS04250.1 MAG: hypothetical protein IPK50_18445 [Fibrobacterota bacterium]
MSFELSLLAADSTVPEPDRCEKLSEIIRNIELPERRKSFLTPAVGTLSTLEPTGEAVIRTLFHVGTTWRNFLLRVRHLRNLRKLRFRRERGETFGPEVDAVVDSVLGVDLEAYAQAIDHAVQTGIFPDPAVISILPLEAACLRERTRNLADTADPYNMKIIARLLPLLRIHDELADRLEVLNREVTNGISQAPDLGLIKFLGEKEYGALGKVLAEMPSGRELSELFSIQRRLQLDPPILSALFTLARSLRLPRPDAPWLEMLSFWFRAVDPSSPHWTLRCTVPPYMAKLLDRGGVRIEGATLSFSAGDLVLPALLDAHTASVDLSSGRKPPPPDWKGLVLSNITRDTLITSFLANHKCVRVPGLVECVVVNSRSLQILSLIATKRDLYTGHQNKGVPAALLRSRSKIPMSLLRRFIHIRFVSRAELKDLAIRAPRADVQKEIEMYLATI